MNRENWELKTQGDVYFFQICMSTMAIILFAKSPNNLLTDKMSLLCVIRLPNYFSDVRISSNPGLNIIQQIWL